MLDVTGLLTSLANRFHNCRQVEESIYRFERMEKGAPYAVYFLDVTEELPVGTEELAIYQDRVIAPYYFEGQKSLQWSNYLYFLMSPQDLAAPHVQKAKMTIERDRRYARKFVIAPDDFDAVLKPPVFTPAGRSGPRDIMSVWTEELERVGIYDAVMSKAGVRSRVDTIQDSGPPARPTRERRAGTKAEPTSFIRRLTLETYRSYPRQREFDFGTVNLFVGPNGSGKTSLLEAIELFFCGQNKRNPGESTSYRLVAHLPENQTEVASNDRPLQFFRDRNLTWYGVDDVKVTNLYRSFARFNFLDTDAAVSLAERAESLEEDLSKLLVGPGAAQLWSEIERIREGVKDRLHPLRSRVTEKQEELDRLKAQIMEAALIKPKSDALEARLTAMLQRLNWTIGPLGSSESSDELVQMLSELISVGQQLIGLSWIGSPVTRSKVGAYLRGASITINRVEILVTELESWRNTEHRLVFELTRLEAAAPLAEQVKHIYTAGLPSVIAELESLQAGKHAKAAQLTGYHPDYVSRLPESYLGLTISAAVDKAVTVCSRAGANLVAVKKDLADFQRLRDQSINLAQQLRATADHILQNSPRPDQCPLCHAQYGQGELAHRITLGVDDQVESAGQALLDRVRRQEQAHSDAMGVKAAVEWVKWFSQAISLPDGLPLRTALDEVETIHRWLGAAAERLATLQSQIEGLNSQGLSITLLPEVASRLQSLGFPLVETAEAASDLAATIANTTLEVREDLRKANQEANNLELQLHRTTGIPHTGSKHWKEWLPASKEQLVTTEALQAKLNAFASAFPWPSAAPLAELVVEAESIRRIVVDLQTALAQERQHQKSSSAWSTRKEQLEAETDKLKGQIDRLTEAEATLKRIVEKHSLTSGMQTALHQNRTTIETIFSRIHSPAEFQGLGNTWDTLIRKADGSEAGLTQISTGQRAAFALSLFLAQNAQLPAGAPPVVLIDDPVAHVDDLNCLSFLDYLRELVLSGDRQVFFATANQKLAALFQRKFEFLDSEFCRFDLTRELPLL